MAEKGEDKRSPEGQISSGKTKEGPDQGRISGGDKRSPGGATTRRRTKKGPLVRETWLHRRARVLKIDIAYLEDLAKYAQDELLLFAIGNFFFSGAAWLFIESVVTGAERKTLVLYGSIAVMGLALAVFGWRQMTRTSKRLQRLLDTVEEEEDVQ